MSSKPRFVGEKVRLGDVATYVNGYAFKPSDYSDSGLPIVRIQNLTGNAYRTNRYEGTLPEKFAIQDGDILISWSASLGVFEWNQGPAWLNQHIFRVVFNKAMIDKRFFVHQARFLIQKSQNLAHGATMKHLTKKVFETLPFLYLGLNNQITIAEQLDALDTQINRAKRQIRFLDNLAKSRFVEMFASGGFPSVSFGDVCLKINNGITRRGNDPDGDIVLRLVELQEGFIDYAKPNRIRLTQKEKERFSLVDGDLLFARVNGNPKNVGRCASFSAINESVYHNDHVIRATFDHSKHNPVFLVFFMNSSKGRAQIEAAITTSAGQYTINQAGIKSIQVPLPPLAFQQEFAAFVSQVDKSGFAS